MLQLLQQSMSNYFYRCTITLPDALWLRPTCYVSHFFPATWHNITILTYLHIMHYSTKTLFKFSLRNRINLITVHRSPSTLRTGLRLAKWPWNCATFAASTSNANFSLCSDVAGDGRTSTTAAVSELQLLSAAASVPPNCWQAINSSHRLNRRRHFEILERQ